MARENIDTGTVANDGTGDDLRTGGEKINNNFIELYARDGEDNTSSNSGTGEGLAKPKVLEDLPFKSLVAGTNITLVPSADEITINAQAGGSGEANTASTPSASGLELTLPKVGVDLPFKSLVQGANITLTPLAESITIDAPVPGEINTSSNEGTGEGFAMPKVADNLPFKTLKAGTNVNLTPSVDELLIDVTASGEDNTASNVGSGQGTLSLPKVGVNLPFKTLNGGTGVTVTNNLEDVTISSDGEANTNSNAGGGVGLVKAKVGVDTPIKSITAGTGITVLNSTNEVSIGLSPTPAYNYGIYAQTANGPLITTQGAQSIIGTGVGGLNITANTFQIGDSFHAKLGGVLNATGGGSRSEIELSIMAGAQTLATTGVFDLDNATNQGWELEIDFTIQTLGVNGTIATNGNFAYTKDGGRQVFGYIFQDVSTFDTTINNMLDITADFIVLNAGDDILGVNFILRKIF